VIGDASTVLRDLFQKKISETSLDRQDVNTLSFEVLTERDMLPKTS
jgi:hypothetical protein